MKKKALKANNKNDEKEKNRINRRIYGDATFQFRMYVCGSECVYVWYVYEMTTIKRRQNRSALITH